MRSKTTKQLLQDLEYLWELATINKHYCIVYIDLDGVVRYRMNSRAGDIAVMYPRILEIRPNGSIYFYNKNWRPENLKRLV